MPFNQEKVLVDNMDYLKSTLELEEIEVRVGFVFPYI